VVTRRLPHSEGLVWSPQRLWVTCEGIGSAFWNGSS